MKRRCLSLILMLCMVFSLAACSFGGTSTGGTAICQHRDVNDDGVCDRCDNPYTDGTDLVIPCQHRDKDDDGSCDRCEEAYSDGKDIFAACQHRDADDNSACDKCGESYEDGKDIPDSPICQHRDADDNGKCDKCAEDYEDGMDNLICLHGDANKDHLCDYGCEILFGICEDKDFDGACDYGCEKPYKGYSQGLAFVSNGDGTCYVSGIGSCTDTDLIIPPISPAGDRVTRIGDKAFYECIIHLTSVVIPEGVKSIGEEAFLFCIDLTNVVLPEGLERIEEATFYCCIRLMSITIPASVTQIDNGAFEECYSLVEVINHSSLEIQAGSSNYGYIASFAKEVHSGESKIDHQGDYFFYTYGGIHYLVGYMGEETSIVLP